MNQTGVRISHRGGVAQTKRGHPYAHTPRSTRPGDPDGILPPRPPPRCDTGGVAGLATPPAIRGRFRAASRNGPPRGGGVVPVARGRGSPPPSVGGERGAIGKRGGCVRGERGRVFLPPSPTWPRPFPPAPHGARSLAHPPSPTHHTPRLATGSGARHQRPLSPPALESPTRSHGGGSGRFNRAEGNGGEEKKKERKRGKQGESKRRAGRAHTEAPAARADCGAGRPIRARGAYHPRGEGGGGRGREGSYQLTAFGGGRRVLGAVRACWVVRGCAGRLGIAYELN